MSATPRGDLPRNEGWRNFPYGPNVKGHARPSILSVRFHAIKTQEDADASTSLFEAILDAGQARMCGDVIAGSRDRALSGKARIRARKAGAR
jgi:hypothetical protein